VRKTFQFSRGVGAYCGTDTPVSKLTEIVSDNPQR
jgi:hypothetical protein